MVFFGIFGSGNLLRDGERTSSEPGDTEETIRQYITAEFMREVIGEGQLYFYYKRLAMEEILSGSEFNEEEWTESMDLQYYVWPLPKTETDQRVNVN